MRRYDLPLLIVTLVLVATGLIFIYSSSWYIAESSYKDSYYFLKRQGFSVAIGLILMLVLARIPYQALLARAPYAYGAALMSLVLVWMPGLSHNAKGATRWFKIAGVSFQPAELAKLTTLICLAAFIQKNKGNVNNIKVLLGATGGLFPILFLLIIQPDFGSTMIIAMLFGMMLVLSGLRLSWVLPLGGVAGVLGTIALYWEPYRVKRLMNFMDPCSDPAGGGYQVCQALIALHNGGFTGMGLEKSQSKRFYLPEPHNDFIVAVIGEELGLIGITALLGLFAFFTWRALQVARKVEDPYAGILAGTLTAMIVVQACLNLGVVTALLPPKGLVLPFISYGNSAMMINLAAIGILLSISAEVPEPQPATPLPKEVLV
jgi:cell division protein FtsW